MSFPTATWLFTVFRMLLFLPGFQACISKSKQSSCWQAIFFFLFINTLCLHAWQPGVISPKPPCLAVIMCICEIFLLQNKSRVAKNRCPALDISNFLSQNKCQVGTVYKNRCPVLDLATFYHRINAACVLILSGI